LVLAQAANYFNAQGMNLANPQHLQRIADFVHNQNQPQWPQVIGRPNVFPQNPYLGDIGNVNGVLNYDALGLGFNGPGEYIPLAPDGNIDINYYPN